MKVIHNFRITSFCLSRLLRLLILCCAVSNVGAFAGNRPNIVLFIADDLGYDDISTNGNTLVETPALSQLQQESISFNRFHVAPACSPTRASLYTGRDHWRTGVTHVHGGSDFLAVDEVTIAETLRANGYRTGFWGKWHSGKSPGYLPWDRGFDEAYYGELYKHPHAHGFYNGQYTSHGRWSPEVLRDYAANFIKAATDRPFFACISFLAVHEPLDAPPHLFKKYQDRGLSPQLAALYAMTEEIDNTVGKVLDVLEESGKSKDTLVIFISDNGPTPYNTNHLGHFDESSWTIRNQWHELRGRKGQIWENGVRSPMYLRWPGHLLPGTVDIPTQVMDIYPTLVEITGSRLHPHQLPLDGVSLFPLITNGTDTSEFPDRQLVGHAVGLRRVNADDEERYKPIERDQPELYPFELQTFYARNERFKLLLNPDGAGPNGVAQWFLFDLVADPREKSNCISDHPDQFALLREAMESRYSDIWEEDRRFQRPVYRIGLARQERSMVNAFGPTRLLGNARNSDHYLEDLFNRGDGAEWEIFVQQPGSYDLVLTQFDSPDCEAKIRLSIGKEVREIILDRENRFNTEPRDIKWYSSNRFNLGRWTLEAGRQVMKFELVEPATDQDKRLNKLRHFEFHWSELPPDLTPYIW